MANYSFSFCNVGISAEAHQEDQANAASSQDSWLMLQHFKEAFRVSLYRLRWPPWECFPSFSSMYMSLFGSCLSDMRHTCPAHLRFERFSMAKMLTISALTSTSVSGTLSCHLMCSRFLSHLMWKEFSLLVCRLYTVQVSQVYSSAGRTTAQYTLNLV